MRFWLAAFEFDYGITAAYALGPTHITLEYARTSQHPLIPAWSEVSTDIVRFGIVVPDLRYDKFTSTAMLGIPPTARFCVRGRHLRFLRGLVYASIIAPPQNP